MNIELMVRNDDQHGTLILNNDIAPRPEDNNSLFTGSFIKKDIRLHIYLGA